MRKYATGDGESEWQAEAREAAVRAVRSRLAAGSDWLVGDSFSLADIAMATALQFVLPIAARYIDLGPATRRAWTHPTLAETYADLLAWRDKIYLARR